MSLYKPKPHPWKLCSYSPMANVGDMRIPYKSAKEAWPGGRIRRRKKPGPALFSAALGFPLPLTLRSRVSRS